MKITEYIKKRLLFLDGGMGSLLQAKGLQAGELPERWNLTHPDVVEGVHRAYFEAGCNVVNTNTFGANRLKFERDELKEIVRAAVKNADAARKNAKGGKQWIALDIGPTGRMLKPLGDLPFEEAVEIFAEVVRLGAEAGADLVMIETMSDAYETKAALLAAKENCSLPVFVSNAYGADGHLMTGADPEAMVAMIEGLGADAVGVNCSLGPKQLLPIVQKYLEVSSIPVLVKPNAGLPRVEGGKTVYDVSPDGFARDVAEMISLGVRIAGGCCGTTPEHLEKLVKQAKNLPVKPVLPKNITWTSSYTHAVRFDSIPKIIGERINPTGKKLLKEALRTHDLSYVLSEGIKEEENGAHILDVNVGLPEIDEASLLSEVVAELQAVTALPLQIDSSNPRAMERALRIYNGKPLLNSVNGKKESMDEVFPLAKKYGAAVIALTLDEDGIPAAADGRVKIACKILAEARRYGLSEKDLIFDPLALTVSADQTAAKETLEAVRRITEELGCHTSLGVSNVSFGLPNRDLVNGAFFTLAMENGLSAAILNPSSVEMKKAYFTYLLLAGLDAHCADFIAFQEALPTEASPKKTDEIPPVAGKTPENTPEGLQKAIFRGLCDKAGESAAQALADGREPLSLITGEIIPALDEVGKGFEEKRVYLPQLLMSAEAAKAAFEKIKAAMPDGKSEKRGSAVLATVKGDIHDIGKNIVKLLLENYGFDVIDLGRDVPPERVLEATLHTQAPLVGLSALMTTTVPAMEETVRLLHEKAPFAKTVVGGAVLTPEYAKEIGADFYAKDAMETVRIAESVVAK